MHCCCTFEWRRRGGRLPRIPRIPRCRRHSGSLDEQRRRAQRIHPPKRTAYHLWRDDTQPPGGPSQSSCGLTPTSDSEIHCSMQCSPRIAVTLIFQPKTWQFSGFKSRGDSYKPWLKAGNSRQIMPAICDNPPWHCETYVTIHHRTASSTSHLWWSTTAQRILLAICDDSPPHSGSC